MAKLSAGEDFAAYFSSPDAINRLFDSADDALALDLDAVDAFYAKLDTKQIDSLVATYRSMVKELSLCSNDFWEAPRGMRFVEVVLLWNALVDPYLHSTLLVPLLSCISSLSDSIRQKMAEFWSANLNDLRMGARLALFHQVITMRLLLPPAVEDTKAEISLVSSARAMAVLYKANSIRSSIKFSEFYNDSLNAEINLVDDFVTWMTNRGFSFCTTPFILDPANKAHILKFESQYKQQQQRSQAMQQALRMAMLGQGMNGFNPFLVFGIRRDHLIQDTLENIVRIAGPEDLKKELKIKFRGEEGIDAGGVQKEFFQLIVKEIFNPDFGMFVLDPDTRAYWFRSLSQEFREFELIGTILGLAIYNSVILDVHFPHVVYKKLMNRPTTLLDLKDVSPDLHRGMKTLLEFEGSVEEVYARDFSVEVDNFGVKETRELKPDGASIALTNENRAEYVELYVDYYLNKSVERQFDAFKRGFDLVVNGPAFSFFTPEELELLICGDPVLDFEELEKATVYENEEEFGVDNEVVKWFWELLHAMPEEQKKLFLHFTTGSDRAPIGGLKNLQLVIQRHGEGDERLPSSHTCFNHLLLPRYSTKQALEAKLKLALENSLGFGLA